MKRIRIGILVHKDDVAFIYFKYLIKLVIKEWKGLGFAVVIIRGTDRFVPADVVISHIDLTVVPNEYKEFLAQYPVVINGNVPDISKTKISSNLVGKDDPYAGPVIVKTDRNSGGFSETRMIGGRHLLRAAAARLTVLGRPAGFFRQPQALAWADVTQLKSGEYPVFSSLQEVPPAVFENKHLVIEKFLPEVRDDRYHIRYYHFLGDKDIAQMYQSKSMVVKASTAIAQKTVPTPPELPEFRKRLGLDYGKIDYVVRDGNVILLDVNPTPALPARDISVQQIAKHLADGFVSKLTQ
jgi:hypothetical protein